MSTRKPGHQASDQTPLADATHAVYDSLMYERHLSRVAPINIPPAFPNPDVPWYSTDGSPAAGTGRRAWDPLPTDPCFPLPGPPIFPGTAPQGPAYPQIGPVPAEPDPFAGPTPQESLLREIDRALPEPEHSVMEHELRRLLARIHDRAVGTDDGQAEDLDRSP